MAVSQKLVERLKAFETANKHGAAIAELNAEADKAEAEGFKGSHLRIHKAVFDELVKLLPGEVEWVEPFFFRGEVTIEDFTDYHKERNADGEYPVIQKPQMHFGWRGGDFRFIGVLQGLHPYWTIDFERTHTSSWRSRETDKVRIYVGDYGNKVQFKQLKDGTHRYLDIAAVLARQADNHKAKVKALRTQNANRSAAQVTINGLKEKHRPYHGVRIESSVNVELPVLITIDKKINMTPEAAIELLDVLRKHGIG